MPTELKGRYYNPWNPDVASRGLLDVVEVSQDASQVPRS